MNISEDMTVTTILGEAAVNLASHNKEISVDTLLNELNTMLSRDNTFARVKVIHQALDWLSDFRPLSIREASDATWMLHNKGAGKSTFPPDGTIRLPSDSEE